MANLDTINTKLELTNKILQEIKLVLENTLAEMIQDDNDDE